MMKVTFVPFDMNDLPNVGPFVVERFHMHRDHMRAVTSNGCFEMRLPKKEWRYAMIVEPVEAQR